MKVEWKKLNTGRHNTIIVEQDRNGDGKRQNKNLNQWLKNKTKTDM